LFIAGWVISYTLAGKDNSQCLDESFEGLSFTFRTWLWVNFGFSITITILFMLGITFTVFESDTTAIIALIGAIFFVILTVMKVIWIIVGIITFLYFLNF
jgi:hypothetical protein